MKVIDIHIHGGFGINFDFATKDEIRTFAKLAYKEGIVAFCPTLTGGNIQEMQRKLKTICEAKTSQNGTVDEALIIGAHLEGTFLSKEKPGIQDKSVFLSPTIENFKKICGDYEEIVKIVVIAPENKNCSELINYLKNKNIKVHYGHSQADFIDNADGICHLYNGMDDISHKKETMALKALLSKEIYTELIADLIHNNKDILNLTFKTRPKDKIILISDSLPISKSNLDSIEFCNKKIYRNGKDENGTLGGSVKLLPEIVENLIKENILDEKTAIKMAYENPKNYLKLMV